MFDDGFAQAARGRAFAFGGLWFGEHDAESLGKGSRRTIVASEKAKNGWSGETTILASKLLFGDVSCN
jgi:hypothetical protein